ncbi:MAG: PKD domain-containing protein [Betaproteobacteria bacterium]|nr:PKD domain-containing protein [Betaproteobacteria bacterium]
MKKQNSSTGAASGGNWTWNVRQCWSLAVGLILGASTFTAYAANVQTSPVSFFPNTVDFGERVPGFTFSQGSISYSNDGVVPLTIAAINVSPGFAVSGCPVGTVIAASSGCFLTASATPATVGYVEGTVEIITNPPSTNALLILQIRGVTAADGTLVQNTISTGTGSLNKALTFVRNNCAAGPHTIRFNIFGTDAKIIAIGEVPLPRVDCDGTVIDGYSQPGSAANTATDGTTNAVIKIGLDASGQYSRLEVQASNVTVRGLSITGSAGGDGGIYIDGNNNVIVGNFIGTDPSGVGGGANDVGVLVYGGSGNRIGGELAAERNLITGNNGNGVIFDCCQAASRMLIRNNLIGGSAIGDNMISNGGAGIDLQEPGATVIDNVIRFNGSHGIHVKGGDNELSRNRIYGNAGRAICNLYVTPVTFDTTCAPTQDDLVAPYDQDGGAGLNNSGNHLQNHPVISSVIHAEGSTKVGGVLRSDVANAQYRIELFSNSAPGVSQAEDYADTFLVTTDATGEATFLQIFGEYRNHITATATRIAAPYDTSELSPSVSLATANRTLTVQKTGTADGLVVSFPAGISCGSTCTADFALGTSVTLSTDAFGNSVFTGWSGGGCSGTGLCILTMDAAKTVTANFASTARTLTVQKTGTADGLVVSFPAGISCGSTCTADFALGTSVTLSTDAFGNSVFTGWSGGGCSGTGLCTVTMDAAKTVSATFATTTTTLTVQKAGGGSGLIVSNPGGISCGSTCTGDFLLGSQVTLTHDVGANSVFSGWFGACSGTGPCVVTMNSPSVVTATIASTLKLLTVQTTGAGTGTVASFPAGINCTSTCSAEFPQGTMVTLLHDPSGTSVFGGWSGACTGTGACTVTMDAAKTVLASFVPAPTVVTVQKAGNGTGIVASNPAGIDCGATCSATFVPGTTVTLSADPSGASIFAGWGGGGCAGTGVCTLTMNAAKTVTANIVLPPVAAVSAPATGRIGVPFTLNASTSTASGQVVQYRWSSVTRPAGSVVPGLPLVTPDALLTFSPDKLGRYDFQLIVADDLGLQSTPVVITFNVIDADNPTALLEATPALPLVGTPVTLSGSRSADTGGGRIVSYLFSAISRPAGASVFGAPINSASPSMNFTPDRAGVWRLSLKVTDDSGNQSAVTEILLTVTVLPTAVVSAPATGKVGVSLTLDAGGSTSPGSVVQYRWSLGQRPSGSVVPSLPLVSASPLLSFAPDKLGRYDIQLAVTDDNGNQSSPVVATIIVADTDNPTAVLDATPASGTVGLSVTLSGSRSTDTGGGRVVGYQFTAVSRPAGATAFAAPVNSASPSIAFTPDKAGVWRISLVVADDSGNQSAATEVSLVVTAVPVANISAPATGKVGASLTLNASASTSSGSVVQYRWNLGQRPSGSVVPSLPFVSTSPLLTFAPDKLGRYDIQLVVVDDSGNQSAPVMATIIVTDSDNPTAVLDATPASPVVGSVVTLSGARSADTGGGQVVTYRFSAISRPVGSTAFPSVINSTNASITFTPDKSGVWQLGLVVIDDSGNQSAMTAISLNVISDVPTLELKNVASRKDHGTTGTFDLPLKTTIPVTGDVTVEPRISQSGHRIVFTFNQAVTSISDVTATNASGAKIGAASAEFAGNELIVALTGIPDSSRVNIQLKGVNGELNTAVSVGFLTGDVNSSRKIDATDLSATKARSGQVTNSSNFRFDPDLSGKIGAVDIFVVKARQGGLLP